MVTLDGATETCLIWRIMEPYGFATAAGFGIAPAVEGLGDAGLDARAHLAVSGAPARLIEPAFLMNRQELPTRRSV